MLREILQEPQTENYDYDDDYEQMEKSYQRIIYGIRKDNKKMGNKIHLAWLDLEAKFMEYDELEKKG